MKVLIISLTAVSILCATSTTHAQQTSSSNAPKSAMCAKLEDQVTPSKFPGCAPEREFIVAPDMYLGTYIRVHPSGSHVFLSAPPRLWDISKRDEQGAVAARSLPVPLNDESYPVEGDWKLIASPNHSDGMRYYQFDDLLSSGPKASAAFKDPNHNEFYHSVGEQPGSNENELRFRTVLYSGLRFQDYIVKKDSSGRYSSATKGKSGKLCAIIRKPGETKSSAADQEIRRKLHRMDELSSEYSRLGSMSPPPPDLNARRLAIENEHRRLEQETDGGGSNSISTPVISKDGTELIGTIGTPQTTKVLKIVNDTDCEIVEDIGYQTGKAMFSYPEPGKKGKIVFSSQEMIPTASSGSRNSPSVYVYDRDTKSISTVSGNKEAFSSYPSMTRDGRIIYFAIRNGCAGLVVADLNQLPGGNPQQCAKLNGPSDASHTPKGSSSENDGSKTSN